VPKEETCKERKERLDEQHPGDTNMSLTTTRRRTQRRSRRSMITELRKVNKEEERGQVRLRTEKKREGVYMRVRAP
jgi:hypothetical protein